jgi:REP element-mobilizing transposase RayT
MERYRIVEGVGLYFATFTVVDWLPVFISEDPCKIVTDSLNFCIEKKSLRVNAYVIMPTHLHLIVFDADFDPERLKHTLDDSRKFTGRNLADYCDKHMPASYAETFKERAGEDRKRRFWQATQHPVGIFTEKFWKQKMDYLHLNPYRKGLVRAPEDWRFSSAAFWAKTELDNDVNLSDAVW